MAARNTIFFVGIAILFAATLTEQRNLNFSYSGANGPDKWGSLNPAYAACSNGKLQSPIDIVKKDAVFNKNLGPLTRNDNPTNATLINHGYNIGLLFGPGVGNAIMYEKNYTLKQMHWHSPSEHTIDGVRFPLELHLVHKATDGSLAVVAILYRLGDPDPVISQMKDYIDELSKETYAGHEAAQIPVELVKTKLLKRNTKKYFRYVGSLTTPPCTEQIDWSILAKVREISEDQIATLQAPLDMTCKKNSRPLQLLNGRYVERYNKKRDH